MKVINEDLADKNHVVQKLTISGNTVYYDKNSFSDGGGAEKVTDDTYYVFQGNFVIWLSFRESYYHNYPPENWNDTNDLPAFKNIVQSVKFVTTTAQNMKFSMLTSQLQQAIVAFTKSEDPACVKNGQLVNFNSQPSDPEVAVASNGSAIAGIGCDSPSATLFVQEGNIWQELESTQLAFSCTTLKKYQVPAKLLLLSQGAGPVECSNGTSLVTYSS